MDSRCFRICSKLLLGSAFVAVALLSCGGPKPLEGEIRTAGSSGSGRGGMGGSILSTGVGGVPGGTEPTTEDNCGVTTSEMTKLPADVLLVLDVSTSMNGARWQDVTSALDQALPPTDAEINWGLYTYPSASCNVGKSPNVAIKANNVTTVMNYYKAHPANSSANYTPTRKAMDTAVTYLTQTDTTPNPKYIVLATDGEPNCPASGASMDKDSTAAIAAVAAAAKAGVPVFVVGISTDDPAINDTLNGMAEAGGMARNDPDKKYYAANTQADLVTAMAQISKAVASCVFSLKKAPPVPANVAVDAYDQSGKANRIPKDTTHADGWDYTSPASTAIELYGPACQAITDQTYKNVQILFGCGSTIL